eukprot:1358048-Rhodomonas_salina.1
METDAFGGALGIAVVPQGLGAFFLSFFFLFGAWFALLLTLAVPCCSVCARCVALRCAHGEGRKKEEESSPRLTSHTPPHKPHAP